jgi:phosphohistidine phosphatase
LHQSNIENKKRVLLILRHCKSVLRYKELSDHDRPLTFHGKNQAVAAGKLIRNLNLTPDYIISSSAKRAVDTSEMVAKYSDYNGKTDLNPSLYYQNSAENYINVLADVSDEYYKVLVVGHNPSVEDLIEKLTNRIEVMGTCSFARIDIKIKSWREIIKHGKDKIEFLKIWHSEVKDEGI